MCRLIFCLFVVLQVASAQDEGGRIVSPPEGAQFRSGKIDIRAIAPASAEVTLDGRAIDLTGPFPGVLHGATVVPDGEHVLTLTWPTGSSTVQFFVGEGAPQGYSEFRPHPPNPIECTKCHGISRRGRFRFIGGCFSCHSKESFARNHGHEAHILESCGLCHDAHGSTQPKLLVMSKELACKQCHN